MDKKRNNTQPCMKYSQSINECVVAHLFHLKKNNQNFITRVWPAYKRMLLMTSYLPIDSISESRFDNLF